MGLYRALSSSNTVLPARDADRAPGVGGTEPGWLIYIDQRGIPYCTTPCGETVKLRGVGHCSGTGWALVGRWWAIALCITCSTLFFPSIPQWMVGENVRKGLCSVQLLARLNHNAAPPATELFFFSWTTSQSLFPKRLLLWTVASFPN